MSKNKKKTAREKRILVGAFLTAVVIAAGSTFAWFTSTDTVTNRLSANADYDVKIVESFAPPENWLPGEKVDKDVYAVNTGSIEAFAKATVSGVMSMTREVPVPITDDIYVPTEYSYYTYSNGNNSWGDPSDGIPENYNNPNTVNAVAGKEYTVNGNIITTPDDAQKAYVTYEQDGTTVASVTFYKAEGKPNSAHSWDFTNGEIYDCVQLTENERYVIEAGAYLAYCPATDAVNYNGGKFGNKAVAFKEPTGQTVTYYHNTGTTAEPVWEPCGEQEYNNHKNDNTFSDYYSKVEGGTPEGDPTNYGKTDFTPHADGLYVFRRSIVVNAENGQHVAGTETFEYEGYYFLGGKYYKIMNLKVTPDEGEDSIDVAADGITKDGQLKSATAYLVREEKVYDLKPDSFRYDAANNRIIASYATNTENGLVGSKTNLTELAAALDQAEHDLQQAEVLLNRALEDSNIVNNSVKDKTSALDTAQENYNDALAKYEAAVAAFEEARDAYTVGKNALESAKADALEGLKGLVGDEANSSSVQGIPAADGAILAADPDSDGYTGGTLTNNLKKADGTDAGILTIKPAADSVADKYGDALVAFNTWKTANLITQTNEGNIEEIDHQIYVYLKELYQHSTTYGQNGANGNYYKADKLNSKITAEKLELAATGVPADVTHEDLVNELQYAATKITYQYAVAHVEWMGDASTTESPINELHRYHELLTALNIAEKNYNDKLAEYSRTIGNLNDAIDNLVENGDAFTKIATDDTVDKTLIEGKDAWKSQKADNVRNTFNTLTGTTLTAANPGDETTALNYVGENKLPYTEAEIQAMTTSPNGGKEKELWEKWQALQNAKKDLDAVRDQTYINTDAGDNFTDGLPYEGPKYLEAGAGDTLPDGYDADTYEVKDGFVYEKATGKPVYKDVDNGAVATNLQAAWDNYYAKRNAVDEAERKLNAAQNGFEKDGDLNVYIYLKNVSLTGDQPGQWQLLPSDLSDLRAPDGKESAEFYYTSILAGGEVSNQLIDYVELDKSANQDMYKYFDFDLNITLNSVQVGFDENGSRNTQPVNEEWQSVRAAIKDPTLAPVSENNTTVVTWSQNGSTTATNYYIEGDKVEITELDAPVTFADSTDATITKNFKYSYTSSTYTYYGETATGTYYRVDTDGHTYDTGDTVTIKDTPNP